LVSPSAEEHEDIHGEKPAWAAAPHEHPIDEDLYDSVAPKVEPHHLDEHGDLSDEYHEAHGEAYSKAMQHKIDHEERPDHTDDELHSFVGEHIDNPPIWGRPKPVDLRGGVYATQTHVSQEHLDRYQRDPAGPTWTEVKHGPSKWDTSYPAMKHPMFVTHQGRLHAVEGHHRVGAALQRGDSHIMGFHYDADKHGWPDRYDPSTEDPE
jgi:hypothetical protein